MGSHKEGKSASGRRSSGEPKAADKKAKKDRSSDSKKRKRDSVEDSSESKRRKRKDEGEDKKKSSKKHKRSKDYDEVRKDKSKDKKSKKDKSKEKKSKSKDKDKSKSKKRAENDEKKRTESSDKDSSDNDRTVDGDSEEASATDSPADPVDESTDAPTNAKPAAGEPAEDGLQRFPDFSKEQELSEESALQAARMGIPHWLAHPTKVDRDVTIPISDPRFALSSHTVARCSSAEITSLFAVQSAVIPVLRAAHTLSRLRQHVRDLCVSAPTGSGKTLAYVLPIVEKLRQRLVTRLRALVVLPTKDLAHQVKECFDFFCSGTSLRVGLATGDISLSKEQSALVDSHSRLSGGSSRVDILVCTPGRLMDHLAMTPNFSLQHLEFWVMDEADRLLGEAYQEWLPKVQASIEAEIVPTADEDADAPPIHDARTLRDPGSQLDLLARPAPRIQKLLFSATLTQDPAKIARLQLVRPLYISITHEDATGGEEGVSSAYTFPSTLKEFYATCPAAEKPLLLIYMLWEQRISGGVCFTKSLEAAHRLAQIIQVWIAAVPEGSWPRKKIVVAEYSSDLGAAERSRIMRLFKKGKINLLICSDLIARGLDVDHIEAVINYDVPTHMSQYTHRVGRTARAGREGSAYTLVAETQMFHFKKMMKEHGHWAGCLASISPKKAVLESLRQQYEAALERVSEIYS